MKNQFLSLNHQLFALPLLTLLLTPGQALAIFPSSSPCTPTITPVDTSKPTTVVGNGTPASCTEAAFDDAVDKGGIVTFNCGSSPFILKVTKEKQVSTDTIIDGKKLITLDGGSKVRILSIRTYFNFTTPTLTVQNINFGNGNADTGVPPVGSDESGGAIYIFGGSLNVINSSFFANRGALTGQDIAGGAIYSVGSGTTTIVGSTFKGNQASNGGAVGTLFNTLTMVNTSVIGNLATGNGGNPGNGGNGGGIYVDGQYNTANLCGVRVTNNQANAHGGGMIRVSYRGDTTTIDKSNFENNLSKTGLGGGIYLQGTTITIKNSTISKNAAFGAGGLFLYGGYNVGPLLFVNNTVYQNTSFNGLGGGASIQTLSGTILNSTFANNKAAFAGGALFDGSGMSLENTIISNNTPANCATQLTDNGGNIQYPVDNGTLCSNGVKQADPLLGSYLVNGGSTSTLAPASNSPAANYGSSDCPATESQTDGTGNDQRGQVRPLTACTSGAYQLP